MQRIFKISFVLFLFAIVGCCKKDETTAVATSCSAPNAASELGPDTPEARLAAVKDYLKVVPVNDLLTDISEKMGKYMKDEEQAKKFKSLMMTGLDVGAIEQSITDSMTKHFTLAEVKALTAFYSTAEGRGVMKKMGDYMGEVMPVIQKEVYQAGLKTGAIQAPAH